MLNTTPILAPLFPPPLQKKNETKRAMIDTQPVAYRAILATGLNTEVLAWVIFSRGPENRDDTQIGGHIRMSVLNNKT